MRLMFILLLLGAVLWSGYWFIGSRGLKHAFESWFGERREDGWVAEYSDLALRGFPNRFDVTLSDLTLADPGTGLAWEMPFFQILALSYKPHHVIAVWPPEQLVATPLGKHRLTSEDLRASLILQTDTKMGLERSTLTAQELVITPVDLPEPMRIKALTMAVERVQTSTATYRLGLSSEGVQPSMPWIRMIDPGGALPETLVGLSADLTVTFDKPWDRLAIEEARPQPREIDLRLAQARWGQLELKLAGKLAINAQGQPDGQITIKAQNWRDILHLAVASGVLPKALASTVEDTLGLLSGLSGSAKTLDIPLDFRGGRMLLGPVPIGPAPVIILR